MKLLIIVNDEQTIYYFRREILTAFHLQGYDVIVCIPKGDHIRDIEKCGCRVVNIEVQRRGTNPVNDIKFLIMCEKMIKEHTPDLVLTYTVKPNIYGSFACQTLNTPYINNITGLGTALQDNSLLAHLLLALQKIAFKKSSCVFFQNYENYLYMKNKGVISSYTNVEILPGSGVNLDLFSFVPMEKHNGLTRFILVSRIMKDKGINEFFQAASIIKKKYPNTEFHVVGWYEDAKYKSQIEKLVEQGIIIFHGKQVQEDVHKLVAECDCSVLPTYHEGMANVILEAAATGRPVIATNIPGCREAFDDGITGYGCEVRNVESLVNAMEKMILTPYEKRAEMGLLGRKKMEKEFDRHIVAKRYINQIERVAEEKSIQI